MRRVDGAARQMSLRTRMVLSGAVAVVSAAAVTSVFIGLMQHEH